MTDAMMTGCIVGTFLAAAATPLPVQIVGGEKPDPFFTYTLPILVLVITFIGAVISALALRAIWQQLNRADEQIEWAKKDYNMTEAAYKLTLEQATLANAERAKAPNLSVLFDDLPTEVTIRANEQNLHTVHVKNAGDKVAEDAEVMLFMPATFTPSGAIGIDPLQTSLGEPVTWNGKKWFKARRAANRRIVRDVNVNVMAVLFSVPPGDHNIYWRIRSEGRTFPAPDNWGTFTIHAVG